MVPFVDEILELERWTDEDGERIEYRQWTKEDTRVVSGPLGKYRYPGHPFPSRVVARAFWERHGHIVEEYHAPGRWMFRIKRVLRAPLPEEYMRTKHDVKRFVKEWQLSGSQVEVASRTGLSLNQVNNISSKLRGVGVNLKKMPRTIVGNEIDPSELNALIEAL